MSVLKNLFFGKIRDTHYDGNNSVTHSLVRPLYTYVVLYFTFRSLIIRQIYNKDLYTAYIYERRGGGSVKLDFRPLNRIRAAVTETYFLFRLGQACRFGPSNRFLLPANHFQNVLNRYFTRKRTRYCIGARII